MEWTYTKNSKNLWLVKCQARMTVLLAKGKAKVSETVKKLGTSKSAFEDEAKKLRNIICKNDFEVHQGKSRG